MTRITDMRGDLQAESSMGGGSSHHLQWRGRHFVAPLQAAQLVKYSFLDSVQSFRLSEHLWFL